MSCENCARGGVLSGEPKGAMVGGAYYAQAPSASSTGRKRAIIFLTDIFGLPLVNCKIMADTFSERLGCDVWVPDLFEGRYIAHPEILDLMPNRPSVKLGLFSKLYLFWRLLPGALNFYRSRPSVASARVSSFMQKVKNQYGYEQLGVVGYCYGGTIGVQTGVANLAQSLVIYHPGPVTEDQCKAINTPVSWGIAEFDESFGPEKGAKMEAIFSERKGKENAVDYEFKTYKDTVHGFAVRPVMDVPSMKAGYDGAIEQAVAWFQKTIPDATT